MTTQVNYCKVGNYFDDLDDYFGAMNIANLKVAVAGTASFDSKRNRDVFKIGYLAFYLRDTYDFNDDTKRDMFKAILNLFNPGTEFPGLGAWSRDRTLLKVDLMEFYRRGGYNPAKSNNPSLVRDFEGFVPIHNTDFRNYQNQKNEGGDFFVFSDVHWVKPVVSESEILL
jgi:hypothetical protein